MLWQEPHCYVTQVLCFSINEHNVPSEIMQLNNAMKLEMPLLTGRCGNSLSNSWFIWQIWLPSGILYAIYVDDWHSYQSNCVNLEELKNKALYFMFLDYLKVKRVTSAKLEGPNNHSNPSKFPCKANNMIKQLWDIQCQPQTIYWASVKHHSISMWNFWFPELVGNETDQISESI